MYRNDVGFLSWETRCHFVTPVSPLTFDTLRGKEGVGGAEVGGEASKLSPSLRTSPGLSYVNIQSYLSW